MKIRAIYTFGAPRVLDPEAAFYAESSLYPGMVFRHAYRGDLVPETPAKYLRDRPDAPKELYDHAGLIAFFDDDGEIHFGPGPWSRSKSVLRESLNELPAGTDAALAAHRLPGYNAAIYEQCRRNRLPRYNGWNPVLALRCARAAKLSYKGPVREGLPLLGFADARLVTGNAVDVLVALPTPGDDPAFAVLAFRSTGPAEFDLAGRELWSYVVEETQGDAAARQASWFAGAPGRANAAWLREVIEIEATLEDTIDRFCPDRPLVVTGHSKGGAQALLWAMRQAVRAGKPAAPDEPPRLPWKPPTDSAEDWRRPMSYTEVGARIRQLRESHGVTPAELAEHLGLEPSRLSRIETGGEHVQLETLLIVLARFDVSIAAFFDEERHESLTPADLQWVEDLGKLPRKDREAVLQVVRFKLSKGDKGR